MTQTAQSNVTIAGYGISPGLAIGNAYRYVDIFHRDHDWYDIDESEVGEEFSRIERAIEEVSDDLDAAAGRVEETMNQEVADIFRAHQAMLRDPKLSVAFRQELDQELVNAERIVQRVFQRWVRRVAGGSKPNLVPRSEDLADLSRRMLLALVGIHTHTLEQVPPDSVVVAKQLLPSDTVHLSRQSTVAVIVAHGGPGSHAALLTRELGIPAVAQVKEDFDAIANGDRLLVDGSRGTIIVSPNEDTEARFRKRIDDAVSASAIDYEKRRAPARTPGGRRIDVLANIGCREDAVLAERNGADGIGLYRTECLYLSRKAPPVEDELVDEMWAAVSPFRGRSITIRLLDAGGDKQIPFVKLPRDVDPALGRRGVRLLRTYPDLIATQLRALVRLSAEVDLRILVPMVTVVEEMEWTAERLDEAMSSLRVDKRPPLGVLVETPAAALCVAEIGTHADFVSVGTNDLTQYVMAAGRENASVSEYFLDDHPAILNLVASIRQGIGDKPLSLCGELAGNERAIPALIDAGVTALSVAPGRIPAVKATVRHAGATANLENTKNTKHETCGALTWKPSWQRSATAKAYARCFSAWTIPWSSGQHTLARSFSTGDLHHALISSGAVG